MNSVECWTDRGKEALWKKLYVFLLCMAFLMRIYFYIFPKNLWLDEAMVALAIDRASWSELLRGQFNYYQSCPLFFAVINKILNVYTSYSPHVLYFLPTIAGMFLLLLLLKLCQVYEKSNLLAFVCIALAASCKMPLYYSSEFKQYIFEGLVSIFLLLNFIRDMHTETFRDKILSYRYPLLSSISLLIATPSVFVSAAIFMVIFIYLLINERRSFFYILWMTCSRYIVFLLISLIYYFFFLKNDATQQVMSAYWEKFFIPHDINAWPEYIKNVVIPIWFGMFTVSYLRHFFAGVILLAFIIGCNFVYKRNRYEFAVCILPFIFATIAAYGIYPPGHPGLIGARLSFYLFPIIIFISSIGLFHVIKKLFVLIRNKYFQQSLIFLICFFVLCFNFGYISSGLAHQQTFSLFNTAYEEKKDNDCVLIYSASEPALQYWEIVSNKKINYIVIQSNIFKLEYKKIEESLPPNIFSYDKLFIVYSHSWDGASEKMRKIFLEHGCHVETTREVGAVLQKISKRLD